MESLSPRGTVLSGLLRGVAGDSAQLAEQLLCSPHLFKLFLLIPNRHYTLVQFQLYISVALNGSTLTDSIFRTLHFPAETVSPLDTTAHASLPPASGSLLFHSASWMTSITPEVAFDNICLFVMGMFHLELLSLWFVL